MQQGHPKLLPWKIWAQTLAPHSSLASLSFISSPIRWEQEQDPASRVNVPKDTRALCLQIRNWVPERGKRFHAGHAATCRDSPSPCRGSSHLQLVKDTDSWGSIWNKPWSWSDHRAGISERSGLPWQEHLPLLSPNPERVVALKPAVTAFSQSQSLLRYRWEGMAL